MKSTLGLGLAALLLAGGLSGCALFNGSLANFTRDSTMGKALIDLQEAKEKGTITDAEYVKARQEILAGGSGKVGASYKQ